MTASSQALPPVRIELPEQPLTDVRWLRALVAKPMEAWPAAVYKEPLVVSRIMGRQITYVMSPDLIREVLQNQGEAFEKGEFARRGLKPVLGDAILTAEGSHWRWQRRAAAPAFRPEHLSELLPSMLTAAQRRHFAWRSIPDGIELRLPS